MNETFHGNSHTDNRHLDSFIATDIVALFAEANLYSQRTQKCYSKFFLRESKCDCDTCQNVTTIGSFLSSKTLIDGAKYIIMLVRI